MCSVCGPRGTAGGWLQRQSWRKALDGTLYFVGFGRLRCRIRVFFVQSGIRRVAISSSEPRIISSLGNGRLVPVRLVWVWQLCTVATACSPMFVGSSCPPRTQGSCMHHWIFRACGPTYRCPRYFWSLGFGLFLAWCNLAENSNGCGLLGETRARRSVRSALDRKG